MKTETTRTMTWKGLKSRWTHKADIMDPETVFVSRKGTVRFADGTEHRAILDFCETDSNEHYGMSILIADPEGFPDSQDSFADQGDDDFLEKIGKTSKQVFPYRYKYEGPPCRDHHIGEDGWSIC
mgnify:FL=1